MPQDLREVRGGLWQLTLAGYVNCFLILERGPGGSSLTVIDTGLPSSAARLLEAARHIGVPITRVLLTHTHRDHAGGLDALMRRTPGAQLLLTERAAQALRGSFAADPTEPPARVRRLLFNRARALPTGILRDGEAIGRLTLVAAPGHSPEHVAYLLADERALIAGDAFTTRGGRLALVGRPGRAPRQLGDYLAGVGTRLVTWHLPTALRTAARLRDLGPELLLVGHGPPLERPQRPLAEVVAAASRQADRLGDD